MFGPVQSGWVKQSILYREKDPHLSLKTIRHCITIQMDWVVMEEVIYSSLDDWMNHGLHGVSPSIWVLISILREMNVQSH